MGVSTESPNPSIGGKCTQRMGVGKLALSAISSLFRYTSDYRVGWWDQRIFVVLSSSDVSVYLLVGGSLLPGLGKE